MRHLVHQPAEGVPVDRKHAHVAVAVAQVAVHQPPHRLVRNRQPRHAVAHLADAQQPEVVQQRHEVVPLIQFLQRESVAQFAVHPAFADHVAQQVEVAVELPVDRQQVAQLAVVDAHVGVDQIVRCAASRNRRP